MLNKNKFLYIFLIIITLGLILIFWRKKYKVLKIKNYLTTDNEITFSMQDLILYLGGISNIVSSSATQKIVRISFKNKANISIEKIKKLNGISGIAFQSSNISLVVGNCANYLSTLLNKELNNHE